MSMQERWRRLPVGGRAAAIGTALVVLVAVGLLLTSDGSSRVETASDETTTTQDDTTTTRAPVTTTSSSTTSTTVPPTTTTAPPPPPTTSPPPTAPATTVPATPVEFRATVRGWDEGPAYYGIFYGTTFGGDGGFNVFAACRPGTVTVTVLDDGMVEPLAPAQAPVQLYISVEDATPVAEFVTAKDGQVFTSPVTSRVRIQVFRPSNHDVRIKYDCRG